MIKLNQIAESIQEKLNQELEKSTLNDFFQNVVFAFNICMNAGEYKKSEETENSNVVTYYINGVMKTLSSDIEGDANISATYNASMTTSIEFLIPFPEKKHDVYGKFGDAVYYTIQSLLGAGSSEDMEDEQGVKYLVGSKYSIPAPGTKEIRSLVGESLPLTVYGAHYFIASGVNSNQIQLMIENDPVYASHIGIARRTITDGNIFSDKSASKNTVSGTALTISFDAPLRIGTYNTLIDKYLLTGCTSPFLVTLKLPNVEDFSTFTMIIADAGENGEAGLAASVNVRLIESI